MAAVAEYRTPLPGLLAGGLEAAVNRVLALDADAGERLARLEGKVVQLDLEGLGITLYFTFDYGAVEVNLDSDRAADTRVSGTPTALFRLAAPLDGDGWGTPGSGVRIEGDATLARDLGAVFAALDPDWRAPLDEWLGDTLGFQVSAGLRRGAEGLRQALGESLAMAGRYLNDDSDALAGQDDIDGFNDAVDDLRDGIDRLESRLARAERDAARGRE